MLYQIKKILDFSMVESKSLDFSTVGFVYLSLSTVEPESLDFSMQNMKGLNLASIPQTISILGVMKKNLNLVWLSRNHLMIVRSGSPTSTWVRWSLRHLISIEKYGLIFFILIPQTIPISFQIKRKDLILVWWSRNHLILVRGHPPQLEYGGAWITRF